MTWTDSHGRPELVMHPNIKCGRVSYRIQTPGVDTPGVDHPAPTATATPAGIGGTRSPRRRSADADQTGTSDPTEP